LGDGLFITGPALRLLCFVVSGVVRSSFPEIAYRATEGDIVWAMKNNENTPKLISFNKWLADMGITSTTGWRWRKRGIIKTVNIYGRLYVSTDAVAEFYRRAEEGEFALNLSPGKQKGI
jgi:hypothetical protein